MTFAASNLYCRSGGPELVPSRYSVAASAGQAAGARLSAGGGDAGAAAFEQRPKRGGEADGGDAAAGSDDVPLGAVAAVLGGFFSKSPGEVQVDLGGVAGVDARVGSGMPFLDVVRRKGAVFWLPRGAWPPCVVFCDKS